MSDGPHRSLPMDARWKQVAEWSDKDAFPVDDVKKALASALEKDCRIEMRTELLDAFRLVCLDPQALLFQEPIVKQLENLRNSAKSGMERTLFEFAIRGVANGETNDALALNSLAKTIVHRGAKRARQMEEHYLRQTTVPRTNHMRARLETAMSGLGGVSLARQLMKLEPSESRRRSPMKSQGIDEGVEI